MMLNWWVFDGFGDVKTAVERFEAMRKLIHSLNWSIDVKMFISTLAGPDETMLFSSHKKNQYPFHKDKVEHEGTNPERLNFDKK